MSRLTCARPLKQKRLTAPSHLPRNPPGTRSPLDGARTSPDHVCHRRRRARGCRRPLPRRRLEGRGLAHVVDAAETGRAFTGHDGEALATGQLSRPDTGSAVRALTSSLRNSSGSSEPACSEANQVTVRLAADFAVRSTEILRLQQTFEVSGSSGLSTPPSCAPGPDVCLTLEGVPPHRLKALLYFAHTYRDRAAEIVHEAVDGGERWSVRPRPDS